MVAKLTFIFLYFAITVWSNSETAVLFIDAEPQLGRLDT